MQMAHSIMVFVLHLYTNQAYCALLEVSISPQLETVPFVFFSMITETLDCLENLFDVRGL